MKMDFNISGLKCDNPSCDYSNPDIPFEQYEQFINCPCPKCGQSLLTPQAYKMCVAMKNMGQFITKITGGEKENSSKVEVPLDMDEYGHVGKKK